MKIRRKSRTAIHGKTTNDSRVDEEKDKVVNVKEDYARAKSANKSNKTKCNMR